eukprot:TRINITY_DN21365_c0_g1_i2.p1 TRINITY_DN21365_c0_g1~~TRINITY_DN21365_c0_g1_i2.p1  ORF type:complete len:364 (-),score=90.50 TRINITY_DN21365_c0_g1_i2:17-1108(-)
MIGNEVSSKDRSSWISVVLEWLKNQKEDVNEMVKRIESDFPDFQKVWKKYSEFTPKENIQELVIKFNHLLLDRFKKSNITISKELIVRYLNGKIPIDAMSMFLYEQCYFRTLEDETYFNLKRYDLMRLSDRIVIGMIFPSTSTEESPFVETFYESTGVCLKYYPVRLHWKDKMLYFSSEIQENEVIDVLGLCSVVASPKYIQEEEKEVSFHLESLELPNKDIQSIEEAVLIYSIVYLLNNGLNGKLYEWELNGMIKQFMELKNSNAHKYFGKSLATARSTTLFTFFYYSFSYVLLLLRFFKSKHYPYKFLHGQVFNYFVREERNFEITPMLSRLKDQIHSYVDVKYYPDNQDIQSDPNEKDLN